MGKVVGRMPDCLQETKGDVDIKVFPRPLCWKQMHLRGE